MKRVVNIKGREVDCAVTGKLPPSLLPLSATIITEHESRSLHSTEEPTHSLTAAAENTSASALRTALSPLSENPGTEISTEELALPFLLLPKTPPKTRGNAFLFALASTVFYQDIMHNHL